MKGSMLRLVCSQCHLVLTTRGDMGTFYHSCGYEVPFYPGAVSTRSPSSHAREHKVTSMDSYRMVAPGRCA